MDDYFIPVIGLHCSGSSCTAGVLAQMGIYMGNHSDRWDVRAGFEAAGLISVCEATFPFPSTTRKLRLETSSAKIKEFINSTILSAKELGTLGGGKYPHLCAMGEELELSGVPLKPIHVSRPLDTSIRSLVDRSQRRDDWTTTTANKAELVQRFLWKKKTVFLNKYEHLTVDYYNLLNNPRKEIDRISEYLGYQPTKEQIHNAINHVDPTQRTF